MEPRSTRSSIKMQLVKHLRHAKNSIVLLLVATILVATLFSTPEVDCAPSSTGTSSSNNNNNNNNNRSRGGLLSSLFRRQTGSSSSDTSTTSSNESAEIDDPQTQTELDAQKFMDSLPNVVSRALLFPLRRTVSQYLYTDQ